MDEEKEKWPRIRDLPKAEQRPFEEWLVGQTRPLMEDVPPGWDEQDAYYPWDYDHWKAGKGVWD